MVAREKLVTVAEFLKFYDGVFDHQQFELIEGRIVEVTPPTLLHQLIVSNILAALIIYLQSNPIGRVFGDRTAYAIRGTPNWYEPDVSFVANNRMPKDLSQRFFEMAPNLAVEILSKTDTARDMLVKTENYLRAGAEAVWTVLPDERRVDVWRLQGDDTVQAQRLVIGDVLRGHDVLPGFELAIEKVFEGAE